LGDRIGIRVIGVDACRGGWVAVCLPVGPGKPWIAVEVAPSLRDLLAPLLAPDDSTVVGIDMPLGLLGTGWRAADRAARGLLGPRRSSVFAIPPRPVWEQASYAEANRRCRELTGQGFSAQAWGLRVKLLEADAYRGTCRHPIYEVHPELAFGAMAGAPLAASKHTAPGRADRIRVLAEAGIEIPGSAPVSVLGDMLDAAAVAWSARRIAAGQAVVVPGEPQLDDRGREITVRF